MYRIINNQAIFGRFIHQYLSLTILPVKDFPGTDQLIPVLFKNECGFFFRSEYLWNCVDPDNLETSLRLHGLEDNKTGKKIG